MDRGPLLDSPWPADLDPASVPFKVRSETVLHRAGLYDDPTRFDTLTEAEVWMPQVAAAECFGWPDDSTGTGIEATRAFFGVYWLYECWPVQRLRESALNLHQGRDSLKAPRQPTRISAASTGARTVASRTDHHGLSFCPIADRAIHFEDRQEGASCPYCGIHLPKENRTVLVTFYDDGMVVSTELDPRFPFLKRTLPILAILLLGILIISAVASAVDENSNSYSDSVRFNGIILDYMPQNPASIAVEFQVRNAGTVSSGWECTVRAKDESNTYTGWGTFNQDTPLSANNSTTAIGTIMITNEGSAYVNEVWVDGCEARATPTEPPGTSEASG